MLTIPNIGFVFLMPLAVGCFVAVIFKLTKRPALASLGRPCGVLSALLLGYFAHFALQNYAFAEGENFNQKLTFTLSQTSTQLTTPQTAIQWLPMVASACLAVTLLLTQCQCLGKPIDRGPAGQESPVCFSCSRFRSVLIFGLLVVLVAGMIVRLLWSSVYLSDHYWLLSQIGYTVIPALIIGFIWLGSFYRSFQGRLPSRWTVASTIGLSLFATVLLATSGSITFAALQLPMVAAALVGFAFFYPLADRSPANHDGWLIISGVILPVTLGFFFAEVQLATAVLFALSAAMATWLAPKASDSNFKKFGVVLLVSLPAIAAAIWAAIEFSQAVKSPYG